MSRMIRFHDDMLVLPGSEPSLSTIESSRKAPQGTQQIMMNGDVSRRVYSDDVTQLT
jgi:hypothetical protein